MTRGHLVFTAAVIAAVLALGWPQLFRAGYSPDEEFTVFAVRGIEASASHLPLLPSGLLYDRGLAYSYASWAAHQSSGADLPSFRALALLSACASLWFIHLVVSRSTSTMAATLAVFLAAASMPFWAAATTGRFYAPLLAVFIGTLLSLRTLGTTGQTATLGTLGALALLACFGRLVHELAFTLMAIPALCFVVAPRGDRAKWLTAALAIAAGLVAAQALILGLHRLAPPSSGQSMVQRFFIWQVLNLFEKPPDNQFAIPLIILFVSWFIAPRWARLNLVVALAIAVAIASIALTRALATAPLSPALVERVLTEGSRYPLDMFWHIARTTPITMALALVLPIARLAGAGGEWRPIERAAHMLWIGWVLWFGVIESGITLNYLLLPVTLMLVAIAVDIAAILTHNLARVPTAGRALRWSACAIVVALVAADQWRGTGSIATRLEAARPTIQVNGIEGIRRSLQPGDRVACTDELACLMLVGRIDAWLALDDFVRERFVIRRGDGQLVGVYTGRPAFLRPAQLFDGPRTHRTLVVDVFKDLPVGNTREWLPRALREDGVTARALLETPQIRVLEVLQTSGTLTAMPLSELRGRHALVGFERLVEGRSRSELCVLCERIHGVRVLRRVEEQTPRFGEPPPRQILVQRPAIHLIEGLGDRVRGRAEFFGQPRERQHWIAVPLLVFHSPRKLVEHFASGGPSSALRAYGPGDASALSKPAPNAERIPSVAIERKPAVIVSGTISRHAATCGQKVRIACALQSAAAKAIILATSRSCEVRRRQAPAAVPRTIA